MKSYLLIGLGKFGHHLCNNLLEYDCEVMVVDSVEEKIEDLLPVVTSAKIGDCTNPKVLESLGIKNFDA
ncbi:MAG: NAD-binding protein, partial [Butyrivibrio sp.]